VNSVTGTSLIIAAAYATLSVLAQPPTRETLPVVLALLITAAILACAASVSLHLNADRKLAKGATLRKVRTLRGPAARRH
jgi:hypothetical protein